MTLPLAQSHRPRFRSQVPWPSHMRLSLASGQSNVVTKLEVMEKVKASLFSTPLWTETYQTPGPAAANSSASSKI